MQYLRILLSSVREENFQRSCKEKPNIEKPRKNTRSPAQPCYIIKLAINRLGK